MYFCENNLNIYVMNLLGHFYFMDSSWNLLTLFCAGFSLQF